MSITLNSIASGKANLTFDLYKDLGFNFFTPLLDICVGYEGSGDVDDLDTAFVVVLTSPLKEQCAFIVTTRNTAINNPIRLQNLDSLLSSKHSMVEVELIYAEPSAVHAILADAKLNKDKLPVDDILVNKSSAINDLENIVTDAVVSGASDIHFYVYEDRAEAVFRIDGLFNRTVSYSREQARLIIAAGLNTKSADYKNVGDDNEMADVSMHITVDLPDENGNTNRREKINLRTSKSGALEGPHTVMRVIRTSQEAKKTITDLGMDIDIKDMLTDSTDAPMGIILITGPTGSGKSTTLAALYETIDESRKVMLLEDPVEYKVKRRNTVQKPVDPNQPGQGFIDHLRTALRQDPDIIGISEMRSKEVVEIVIKSALTGHLMVSTLHTNDAIGTISRLIDEGVSPKILAERNLFSCIAAQRLIPTLCPHCKVKDDSLINYPGAYVKSKDGCDLCKFTGFKGRVLIAELIKFDDNCRDFIGKHDLSGLENYLISSGWKNMTHRAKMRIEEGLIDPFEAKRHITGLFNDESSIDYGDVKFAF
ncbi:hypothetical protein FQP81_18275 [Pseudoalteromonas distincta]|uniref:GspE/PulE family protein n=1 Tax=Pseudoalteromonas distincta TaxID=77608 RepID=UPI001195A83C|nr:ATPase, T2SS/T4P/T4SS family [Pseudoalteromonas elyakovii]TVU70403.1 hypothetical protein FQP81_18275 [Pseudoalteromonas elyakovii]